MTKWVFKSLLISGLVLAAAGCGGGGSSSTTGPTMTGSGEGVTGVRSLRKGGTELLTGNGYYIIGDCDGSDSENNVRSYDSDGRTLTGTARCPGSPFKITINGSGNRFISHIEVGPAVTSYNSISVPLDGSFIFEGFRFSEAGFYIGCGHAWSVRQDGNSGLYQGDNSILNILLRAGRQPCIIPGAGEVVVASPRRVVSWVEIYGPNATIRRTFRGGNFKEYVAIKHPYTNNIEASIGRMSRGQIVEFEEEIYIY